MFLLMVRTLFSEYYLFVGLEQHIGDNQMRGPVCDSLYAMCYRLQKPQKVTQTF